MNSKSRRVVSNLVSMSLFDRLGTRLISFSFGFKICHWLEKGKLITMQLLFQFKMTPLHLAAEKGNLQAVKKLIENASCPAELRPRNKVSFCLFARTLNYTLSLSVAIAIA